MAVPYEDALTVRLLANRHVNLQRVPQVRALSWSGIRISSGSTVAFI